jgi:hypothetical protein
MTQGRWEDANPNDEDHLFLTEEHFLVMANFVAKVLE